jgi:ubiquinone/menaquinone biosynthesis C-methylase UbiE
MLSASTPINSQYLYARALTNALHPGERWLDLGCGHDFLPSWMEQQPLAPLLAGRWIVGLDVDETALRSHPNLSLRIAGDVERLPLAANTFDLVTANMVVEHVRYPDQLFREVSRVLRPGGAFLVHTPNRQGYTTVLTGFIPSIWRPAVAHLLQRRAERDVYRTFYRANTIEVLQRIATDCDLTIADLRTIGSSPQLFRIPGIRRVETRLLRALADDRLSRWRPCILGRFVKARALR